MKHNDVLTMIRLMNSIKPPQSQEQLKGGQNHTPPKKNLTKGLLERLKGKGVIK